MNVFGYGDFFSDFGIVSASKYDFMHKHKYGKQLN